MSAGMLAVAATLAVGTGIGAVAYQATSTKAPVLETVPTIAGTPSPAATEPTTAVAPIVETLPPAAPSATAGDDHGQRRNRDRGGDDGPGHDARDDHGGHGEDGSSDD